MVSKYTNWQDIINDPGSTTKTFGFLTSNYCLEVLFSDFDEEMFKRVIVIRLDNLPIMLAVSETHKSNDQFLDILQNSQTIPIGVKLFDPKSQIKRGHMTVKQIDVWSIDDKIVADYIQCLGINDKLYFRQSKFKVAGQTMALKEYILPALELIVNNYKRKYMQRILAISPLDGRYFDKVSSISMIASEYGLIKYRLQVEIEWLKLLFTVPEIGLPELDENEIKFLDDILINFDVKQCERVKQIEETTNHDVKAVEYYIKEEIAQIPKLYKYREFIHFACTSEDINNLSYALMLKDLREKVLNVELTKILNKIEELSQLHKDVAIMCRTHGQSATPSTMGKEFYNVYYRLQKQIQQLNQILILGKINGAVGNYNAHMVGYPDIKWNLLAKIFVEDKLGLTFNPFTIQIEPHDYIAEIFDNLRRINTILIDFNRDVWGYISLNYFTQRVIAGEVGSSTMPHKVNPIDFENSEGNLGLANALATHLSEKLPISRFQRDLTDSTVLRNIGVAIAYAVLSYNSLYKGLNKLEINTDAINQDLDNNWELLAEPIQTVMRKCGVTNAYEQLKELTRGKKVDAKKVREFIRTLAIPDIEKDKLLALTPHNYIGLANKLF